VPRCSERGTPTRRWSHQLCTGQQLTHNAQTRTPKQLRGQYEKCQGFWCARWAEFKGRQGALISTLSSDCSKDCSRTIPSSRKYGTRTCKVTAVVHPAFNGSELRATTPDGCLMVSWGPTVQSIIGVRAALCDLKESPDAGYKCIQVLMCRCNHRSLAWS
jgi:hypothetical protein